MKLKTMNQAKKKLLKSKLSDQIVRLKHIFIEKEKCEENIRNTISEMVPPGTVLFTAISDNNPKQGVFYKVVSNQDYIKYSYVTDVKNLEYLQFIAKYYLKNGRLSKQSFTYFVQIEELEIVEDKEVLNLLENGHYKKAINLYTKTGHFHKN
ncbi:hypothetical protein [Chondrinema litorale]|uniref:hypothetical protein n=1 Tax=Chondrinema litorale TaxID=2994555 RepID=UPI00254293A6|nr:hypothetical protein [Chondrinema litorale]UZR97126.1 hypothetical protein OQ292_23805 [Chondrinema litorale]